MTSSDINPTRDGTPAERWAERSDGQHQRLLTALRDELIRASAVALERGVRAEALAAYLDARTTRLTSMTTGSPNDVGEDGADDADDSI